MLHSSLLNQIDEVSRRGSIRAAADVLNVSASSINRRIIQLEEETGTPLFHRHSGGMRVTAAGEVVIAHIRQTLRDYERMKQRLRELSGTDGPRVRISAMHGLAAGIIPLILRVFCAENPGIAITVRSQTEAGVEHDLATGECDLGLAYSWPNGTGISASMTFPTRLGVVVSRDHPLVGRNCLRLPEIVNWPIALADESITINHLIGEAFTIAGYPLRPAFLSNSIELLKSISRSGEAITFLSRIDVEEDLKDGQLVYIPIHSRDVESHELRLGRRRDSTLDTSVTLAEECICKTISGIETPLLN
ncbi:MAG: LysR family transcriptional regulator [Alphaproteobacteria bacterium]|nr:LysR family transcriptional regulator [Alphaproteobacteria bacterium]